ncbi:hypothetical protein [Embleya sp. NPDC059237]|uniref:hypothetical protein n=1 Tax=Embleya sp. NPDC059237 TaxID=3346784 RepID=UPI0036BAD3B6
MSRLYPLWLRALVSNPVTPTEIARRIVSMETLPQGRWLESDDMSRAIATALVAHPDPQIRMRMTENQRLPRDISGRLAEDADAGVRKKYARNAALANTVLSREAVTRMADDPDPTIRRYAGALPGPFDDIRVRLAEDPDPAVRAAVVSHETVWIMLRPAVRERLLGDPDPAVERAIRAFARARARLPRSLVEFRAEADPSRRERVVTGGMLDRDLAEALSLDPDASIRARVAGNEHLPVDLAKRLGHDPDATVRLVASMHAELSEDERAAIDYVVPEGRQPIARWVRAASDTPDALRRAATSAHVLLRRSAASLRRLPPDIVELLARDDDTYVRLMLVHHCDDAPHQLLVDMYAHDSHLSWAMIKFRPNFVVPGLAHYADHPNERLRQIALMDPDAGPELVERLSHDSDVRVRQEAAGDARLPLGRLVELLYDEETASFAAANSALPVEYMHQLLDQAGVPPLRL